MAEFQNAPALLEVYTQSGSLKSAYQIGSGVLLGVTFMIGQSGPESFTLKFSDYAEIENNNLIKIRVFGGTDYFFTGVVRNVPIEGSTDEDFTYTGFGLSEYFGRISTESKTYTGQTVEYIIEDLLDDVIVPKTPIEKDVSLIDSTGVTVNDITFDYIQMSEALKQLKELAQASGIQYITGVNQEGKFFFLQRDETVIKTLVVGKNSETGIPYYNPSDENEARTKYFIKKSDGTFYGTVQSIEDNDIYEETLTAPEIDDDDLISWATGILTESEINTRKATIEWQIETENPTVLIGDGRLRIISNRPARNISTIAPSFYGQGYYGQGLYGGEQPDSVLLDDTLRILSVEYIINDSMAKRNIQLGLANPSLLTSILQIRSELKGLKISLGV